LTGVSLLCTWLYSLFYKFGFFLTCIKILYNISNFFLSDEPFPPGQPKCVDRDREHIKIKWEPPENDGGNPVKAYDVERKDPKTNRWGKINKEPVTVSTSTYMVCGVFD
jgi:hypothetical protein